MANWGRVLAGALGGAAKGALDYDEDVKKDLLQTKRDAALEKKALALAEQRNELRMMADAAAADRRQQDHFERLDAESGSGKVIPGTDREATKRELSLLSDADVGATTSAKDLKAAQEVKELALYRSKKEIDAEYKTPKEPKDRTKIIAEIHNNLMENDPDYSKKTPEEKKKQLDGVLSLIGIKGDTSEHSGLDGGWVNRTLKDGTKVLHNAQTGIVIDAKTGKPISKKGEKKKKKKKPVANYDLTPEEQLRFEKTGFEDLTPDEQKNLTPAAIDKLIATANKKAADASASLKVQPQEERAPVVIPELTTEEIGMIKSGKVTAKLRNKLEKIARLKVGL